MLTKLGIKPFEYKVEVQQVFQDASVFDAAVLDMSEQMLISKFLSGTPTEIRRSSAKTKMKSCKEVVERWL